jgi:hypothetical protein
VNLVVEPIWQSGNFSPTVIRRLRQRLAASHQARYLTLCQSRCGNELKRTTKRLQFINHHQQNWKTNYRFAKAFSQYLLWLRRIKAICS